MYVPKAIVEGYNKLSVQYLVEEQIPQKTPPETGEITQKKIEKTAHDFVAGDERGDTWVVRGAFRQVIDHPSGASPGSWLCQLDLGEQPVPALRIKDLRISQGVLQVFLREHRHRREVGREDGQRSAVCLAVSE